MKRKHGFSPVQYNPRSHKPLDGSLPADTSPVGTKTDPVCTACGAIDVQENVTPSLPRHSTILLLFVAHTAVCPASSHLGVVQRAAHGRSPLPHADVDEPVLHLQEDSSRRGS